MKDYRDSKGITHWTESGRDRADHQYVQDFVNAQRLLAAQEEQVAIQRSRAAAEDQHRKEDQKDRELTRDIQWLERSDAKGKLDFLVNKALIYLIFNSSGGSCKTVSWSFFEIGSDLEWSERLIAKNKSDNADPSCSRLISATDELIAIFHQLTREKLAMKGPKKLPKTLKDQSVQPAGWFAGFLAARSKNKRQQAHKNLLEQQFTDAKKEAMAAKGRFSSVLREAVMHRDTWLGLARHDNANWRGLRLKEPNATRAFGALIELVQKSYPPLCRIQLSTISARDLEAAFTPLRTQMSVVSDEDLLHFCKKAVLGNGGDPIAIQCFEELTRRRGPLYQLHLEELRKELRSSRRPSVPPPLTRRETTPPPPRP